MFKKTFLLPVKFSAIGLGPHGPGLNLAVDVSLIFNKAHQIVVENARFGVQYKPPELPPLHHISILIQLALILLTHHFCRHTVGPINRQYKQL